MLKKTLLCGISVSLYISQLSFAEACKRMADDADPSYQVKPGTPALKKRKIDGGTPVEEVENAENNFSLTKAETDSKKRKSFILQKSENEVISESENVHAEPPKKKRKLASREDICEEIVTILFSKNADLEPGEQEAFKTTLHFYAQNYPFLFTPSNSDRILELSRAHAPKETEEEEQQRKESISKFTEALGALADSEEELKIKEFTEIVVNNVFLNVQSEKPESLKPLKTQFQRALKRPIQQLLMTGNERVFSALSAHYSINRQNVDEYEITKYVPTITALLSSLKELSADDLNQFLGRLLSFPEIEAAWDKKTEVAKNILRDMQWERKEKKNKARQEIYAELIKGMVPPKADDIQTHQMWIYKTVGDQQTVFPLRYEREGKTIDTLDAINEWAKEYGTIAFYDSYPITNIDDALQNTTQAISAHPNGERVQLVDIQSLPTIQENKDIFQNTDIDVYFRSDLARLVATYDTVMQNPTKRSCILYADFKMAPMPYAKLMDPETIYNLITYNIAFARGGHLGFENGFHIAGSDSENLRKVLNLYIELCLELARDPKRTRGLTQIVYDNLPKMFHAFYALEQKATLTYGDESFDKVVDTIHSKEDLYKWFDPQLSVSSMPSAHRKFGMINEKFPELSKEDTVVISGHMGAGGVAIPTKFDRFPPSHFG
jgi:hypothetical protein